MNFETQVWGIRAGKNGSANDLFMKDDVIALEDAGLGDLSKLEPTRDEFYEKYRLLHPEETRTGSAGIAGKFFRFVAQVSIGDSVVYPCLIDKCIYVGVVKGEYTFVKAAQFPHQREITWNCVIPKASFSMQARHELGAARTFFAFKGNVSELERLVDSDQSKKFKKSDAPMKRKKSRK